MNKYKIYANGTEMGIYEGKDEDEAIDNLSRDAGYEDFEDEKNRIPNTNRDDMEIYKIDEKRSKRMNGTKKQIKWAEDIIASIENSAKETIKLINEKRSARIKKLISRGKNNRVEQINSVSDEQIAEIEEIFQYIPKIKQASNVIDLRLAADNAKAGRSANWRLTRNIIHRMVM